MRRLVRFLLTIVILTISGFIMAALLPKSRERTRSIFFRASPRSIFEAILDAQNQRDWRTDLREISVRRRRRKWTETLRGNIDVEYQITRTEPDEFIEMAFFSDLGFSGKKTIEIIEHDEGSNVTFTEIVTYDRWYMAALACLANLFDLEMDRYIKDLKSYIEDEDQSEEERADEGEGRDEKRSAKRRHA